MGGTDRDPDDDGVTAAGGTGTVVHEVCRPRITGWDSRASEGADAAGV
jgi:hypothetical protein